MNLKNISDKALLNGAEKSAQAEQEATINLLHHLLEIDRRRLFSSLKYPSLFAYVVNELKYPEDRAARRISAARLLRDVPAIEEKVTTGELSLTNMVMAQTLFAKEKKAGKTYIRQSRSWRFWKGLRMCRPEKRKRS